MLRLFEHRGCFVFFFFFNDTATTEIYTLSLHDALPISAGTPMGANVTWSFTTAPAAPVAGAIARVQAVSGERSEEHTSELQSRLHLVCRLLLEKKKNTNTA